MIYNSPCVAPTAVSAAKKLKCFSLTKTYDFSDKQVATETNLHGATSTGTCFYEIAEDIASSTMSKNIDAGLTLSDLLAVEYTL
jgi:hypothetical protein